ncbi:MAG: CvpA family protein [Anaerolineae bacterium]
MVGLNWFDLALFIALLAGLAVGYYQGLVRQLINLAAFYLGAIVASQYYSMLGYAVKGTMATTPGLAVNAGAFFVIMMIVVVILNILALDATKMMIRLPPVVEHLGGMVLGLSATWVFITIAVSILLVITQEGWSEAEGARQIIYSGVHESQIAHATQTTLPALLGAIKPWLPGGIPNIFKI